MTSNTAAAAGALTYWLLPTSSSVVVAPQILLKSFFAPNLAKKYVYFHQNHKWPNNASYTQLLRNPGGLTSIADEYFLSSLVAVSSLLATHLPNFMIYLQTGTLSPALRGGGCRQQQSGESRATSGVWESVFQLST